MVGRAKGNVQLSELKSGSGGRTESRCGGAGVLWPLEQVHLLGLWIVTDGELAFEHLQKMLAGQLAPPALQDGQLLRRAPPALQGEQLQVRGGRQELRRDGGFHSPYLQGRPEQIREPCRLGI